MTSPMQCGRMLTDETRCPNPPHRVHLVQAHDTPLDAQSEARLVVVPLCADHDWTEVPNHA